MAIKGRDVAVGAVGVAAGALIGAGVALLAAPRSGGETRREISKLGKKARREVGRLADDFSGKVDGVIRSMEDTARGIADIGREVSNGTARTVRAVVSEGREALARRMG